MYVPAIKTCIKYRSISPICSVFYLRKVTVIYDKMFTDEQVENNKILKEEFGISPNTEAEKKAKAKIAERNRLRAVEESLMDNSSNNSEDAK